jgi:hypothetical protein
MQSVNDHSLSGRAEKKSVPRRNRSLGRCNDLHVWLLPQEIQKPDELLAIRRAEIVRDTGMQR